MTSQCPKWISNMRQDFPISHFFYYKRTTGRAPLYAGFKGSQISWGGTPVPEVILFRLLLIASKTHVNKAVGKRPSLTLTVSDNNLNISVTPFFRLPRRTVVTSATVYQEGVSEPTKDHSDASDWEHLPKLQLAMHRFSMAQPPREWSDAAGERDTPVLQSDRPR